MRTALRRSGGEARASGPRLCAPYTRCRPRPFRRSSPPLSSRKRGFAGTTVEIAGRTIERPLTEANASPAPALGRARGRPVSFASPNRGGWRAEEALKQTLAQPSPDCARASRRAIAAFRHAVAFSAAGPDGASRRGAARAPPGCAAANHARGYRIPFPLLRRLARTPLDGTRQWTI